MKRVMLGCAFVALFAAATVSAAGVQPRASAPPAAQPAANPPVDERNARDTQQRLQELLRNHPPSLARVLQLDPPLLRNAEYVAPSPALPPFIAQPPDIVHPPSFYLGEPNYGGQE